MGRRLQQSGKCFRRTDFESTVLGVYSTEYSPLPVRFFLCPGRSSRSYSVGLGRDSRSTACLHYTRNSRRNHAARGLSLRSVEPCMGFLGYTSVAAAGWGSIGRASRNLLV